MPRNTESLRVALVDHDRGLHRSVRQAFKAYGRGWELDSFLDGQQALTRLPSTPPDVLLMGIEMPGLGGIDCLQWLKLRLPSLPVVMLSACFREEELIRCVAAGALGYLTKPVGLGELRQALSKAAQGRTAMCPEAEAALVNYMRSTPAAMLLRAFSPRQRQVLTALLEEKHQNKDIAQRLGISCHTVREHLRRIFQKLGARTRKEAVEKAFHAPHSV
jgi:DNA-binding NarL/FixJ family response regulator